MTIVIGGGIATAIAGGPLDLSELGPRRTRRLSRVEFDAMQNVWVVTDMNGRDLYHHKNYDECLRWERDHFEAKL